VRSVQPWRSQSALWVDPRARTRAAHRDVALMRLAALWHVQQASNHIPLRRIKNAWRLLLAAHAHLHRCQGKSAFAANM